MPAKWVGLERPNKQRYRVQVVGRRCPAPTDLIHRYQHFGKCETTMFSASGDSTVLTGGELMTLLGLAAAKAAVGFVATKTTGGVVDWMLDQVPASKRAKLSNDDRQRLEKLLD